MERKNQPTTLGGLFKKQMEPINAKVQQKKKEIWVPEFARFKLQFKMRNGSTSIPYHSYDTRYCKNKKMEIIDEAAGLIGLMKLIDKKRCDDSYVVASIWCKSGPDRRTYIDGRMAMDYDFLIVKHVRNQNVWKHPDLHFDNNGILNTAILFQSLTKNQ